MIKNYFKTAWRYLKGEKTYTLINIIGLTISLIVFIVILLFVNRERSYDGWDNSLNEVYRLGVSEETEEGLQMSQSVPFPLGTLVKQNFPEVMTMTRVKIDLGERVISTEAKNPFYFNKIIYADSNFFSVFPYLFLEGNKDALNQPNTVVITKEIAQTLFGTADPMDKVIYLNVKNAYVVKGVIEKPGPSHLDFDICFGYHSMHFASNWFMKNFDTYIRLRPDAKPDIVAEKAGKEYASNYARSYPGYEEAGDNKDGLMGWLATKYHIEKPSVFLEPVKNIHLQPLGTAIYSMLVPVYDFDSSNNVPIRWFTLIGVLVLALACINYINMSVAQNIRRTKDSGIRKVLGASRMNLVVQYIMESFLICMISLIMAVGVLLLSIEWINQQFQLDLDLWNPVYQSQNILVLIQLTGVLLITSFITGIYPAYVLSSHKPVTVLKGSARKTGDSGWLQNLLVVLQYGIASCFIICIVVVTSQLRYMRQSDPGFDASEVLRIEPVQTYIFPGQPKDRSAFLKSSLMKIPGVSDVSFGSSYPGMIAFNFQEASNGSGQSQNVSFGLVDYDYFKILGIPLMQGRTFSTSFGKDTVDAAVINQTLAAEFGWKDATGQKLELMGKTYRVIGVVKDSRMGGYEKTVQPYVYMMGVENPLNFSGLDQVFVKIDTRNTRQALDGVIDFWKQTEPGLPVRYSWLDDDFGKLFAKYERLDRIVFWLTIVSVLIAAMGIFALSAYAAFRRTKEIGIRKVLGASVSEIVRFLSAKFILLVLVSFVVAVPVAILTAGRWLDNFAYRIDMKWWMFFEAGFILVIVAIVAVFYQAIQAGRANPVDSLRTE